MGDRTAEASQQERDGRPVLCFRNEIGEAGKGLTVRGLNAKYPDHPVEIFLIADGDTVYGYLNICLHQGIPLDLKPDTFLDYEREYIQCTTHGALFRKHDGLCVEGPCIGQPLLPLNITVADVCAVILGEGDPFRPGG
ncbi:MAG: Rieske (2Fe-2S) protein [Alphaproteobacteria bacterium]